MDCYKEPPEEVYAVLKPYIRHVHIKDLKIVDGKQQYVLLGTGIVPIFQAIDLLYANQYPGYYSFEWEKLWHPEILECGDRPRRLSHCHAETFSGREAGGLKREASILCP